MKSQLSLESSVVMKHESTEGSRGANTQRNETDKPSKHS